MLNHRGTGQVSLSLTDQAIVSGTNFLTTVIIGRVCGAGELGLYSLAFTLIVLVTNLQTAVLTTPYTIYGSRLSGRARREYAGNVLTHCLLFMVATSLIFAALAGGLSLFQPASQLAAVMWLMVASMPVFLLREFVRRFAFAHFRIAFVLVLDTIATLIQFGGLWFLVQNNWLSSVNAYVAIAVSSAIAAGGAMVFLRDGMSIQTGNVFSELRKSWRLGRWLAATRAASLIQGYAVYWIFAAFIGTAATGVYAACMTLLLAANPFIIGIGNILEPRAASAFAESGVVEMRRVVWNATKLLGGVMGLYCGFLFFAGGWIVPLLFRGDQYENHGMTVAALALGALANAWATGASHGLRILERPDLGYRASILALVTTILLALLLVPFFGLPGGAIAVLAGDVLAATIRWILFRQLSRETPVASTVPS